MKKYFSIKSICVFALALAFTLPTIAQTVTESLPTRQNILKTTELVNSWFMKEWPDPTKPTFVRNKVRPSSLWTRAVYYEGLMALYSISPRDEYYDYTYRWCDFHKWQPRNKNTTRDADDYCCGQTYIDMYRLEPESFKIKNVLAHAQMLVNIPAVEDWWWIDAIQMGMPYLAKLGKTTGDTRYWDKMWEIYEYTRNQEDGGMYNKKEGLWWRDKDFNPPYKEPNGEDCYWSRGNGWVIAALVRVMDEIPTNEKHYKTYKKDFIAMCKALKACQRTDGFWNCSLHDDTHFGGKETSGTALFTYAMAWGIRKGYLSEKEYLPVVTKAWNAMCKDAVHPDNGYLGYVQGTGKEPKDGQPTSYDSRPDFEDYGVGCFLLAGSEVYKIAPIEKEPQKKK